MPALSSPCVMKKCWPMSLDAGELTAEEHSIIGGLGCAVAAALRRERNLPIEFVGIKDAFGISALSYEELLDHYGLTAGAIKDAVKIVLEG